MTEPAAVLAIAFGATRAAAVETVLPLATPGGLVVLPSSGSRRDRLAATVRSLLRARGIATSLAVPDPMLAKMPVPATGSRWRPVEIAPPDREPGTIRLPDRLLAAPAVWTATDVDAVGGRGPYVLDLLLHYAPLVDRVRLVARRARTGAEVNLARRMSSHFVSRSFGNVVLAAATSDPVAAEILALSLAEENLPPGSRVEGVWEDRVVQRATELGIGIQTPLQIRIELREPDDFPEARSIVTRLALRMGVGFS